MIILDTHVWVWHIQGDPRLKPAHQSVIKSEESAGLGRSAFSLWEIAKAVELGRITFPVPIEDWFALALTYPGVVLLPITPKIAVESTRLPGVFHKDPANQVIVATARVHNCKLLTYDTRIIPYPHVAVVP